VSIQQSLNIWQESNDLFRQVVEETFELLCVVDPTGKLLLASEGYARIFGFIPSSVEDKVACIDSEYRIDAQKLFHKTVQEGTKEKLEIRMKRVDGAWIWVETMTIPIHNSEGQLSHVVFASNDITAKKQHENRLTALAYHDPLTGLPNRRLFKEHLNHALLQAKRTSKPLALFYLDIDDFKLINDTMGHDIGDQFLQNFAGRVKGCLREVDTFARMGGDEFTILLPYVEAADHVEIVAKRIFDMLQEPWVLEQHQFSSTVSMGIVVCPEDGADSKILLKKVDKALYQVKETGRNGYQFYQA
jgi:diguanylate cyclase (GGDEF)-like protein/PAS domain S-box-containing protein